LYVKLALDRADSGYLVKAFAAHRIVLARPGEATDIVLTASALVSPWEVVRDWAAPPAGPQFGIEALAAPLALGPEVVLLGSGRRLRWPAPTVAPAVNARGVGFEVMDTASACRTYNVLALEGRRVVAALLMD
jgi:uncharacterized protein